MCSLQCTVDHAFMYAVTRNRRSVAGNFDALTSTLREARMRELDMEERHLKLEEDRLKFEREKWLHQHGQATDADGAYQYGVRHVDPQPVQPQAAPEVHHQTLQLVHFFASDAMDPPQFESATDRVLHPSEY